MQTMSQVSLSPDHDVKPSRSSLLPIHTSPHLLPMPPPIFSRHSSQSDGSEGSDSNGAPLNGRNPGAESTVAPGSRLSYGQASPSSFGAQPSPSATSDTSRQSRNSGALKDEDGIPIDGDASTDFAQTFYDPFRIKHRRRTSPNQLKILEYHFEHNPKPDVTLRKALSEQLDMTPREVQVWFQNRRAKTKKLKEKADKEREAGFGPDDLGGSRHSSDSSSYSHSQPPMGQHHHAMHGRLDAPLPPLPRPMQQHSGPGADYLSLRRGSSPAVLSPNLLGPNGTAYYEPPPMHRGHNTYAPPRQSQPPSFFTAHPNLPPPSQSSSNNGSNVYPSPMSVSASGLSTPSPHEQQQQPFDFLQSPPNRSVEDHGNGRRFSLPAYNSDYSIGGPSPHLQHLLPPHQQPQHFELPPQPFGGVPYASPPLDVQSVLTEMNFLPIDGYDAPRQDGHSPPSSGEELSASEYPGSAFSSSAQNSQQAFPLSQYTFGGPSTNDSSLGTSQPFQNLEHGGPPQDMYAPNERRASCPAGFIPTFDHLALSSPVAAPAPYPSYPTDTSMSLPPQQPPVNLQRRHSLAPTSPSYTSVSPSQGGFFGPQMHAPVRRGSTSAPLGTINEGPQLDQSRLARRVRSQRDLGPYGNRPGEQLRRSPGPSPHQQDRRGSLTDWDPQFVAVSTTSAAQMYGEPSVAA